MWGFQRGREHPLWSRAGSKPHPRSGFVHFEAYRLYVSCYSSTDDIEYLAQYSGDNMLMNGTDYGHVDMSVEIDALRTLEKNGNVRPDLAKKILQENPARFYGIQ